jgi:hypothetical protein
MTSFLLNDLFVGHQSFSLFASQESCLAGAGWDTGDTTAKVPVHFLLPFLEHASHQSLGSNFWLCHETPASITLDVWATIQKTNCKIG